MRVQVDFDKHPNEWPDVVKNKLWMFFFQGVAVGISLVLLLMILNK